MVVDIEQARAFLTIYRDMMQKHLLAESEPAMRLMLSNLISSLDISLEYTGGVSRLKRALRSL